eukprot:CAMPEP_0115706352 /NCGR_PEP_ID=MMETSP0272-20121206/70744_1 /TAXON_ID=71861 /ORGANISM="Scrippsiella trochoidea, Strain CCMP3099" /LENGTH=49 /DNA_ID=CAMNT_0003147593 /DNA_START=25 /DNA_END=174 /DNA_ORIENTATION=+
MTSKSSNSFEKFAVSCNARMNFRMAAHSFKMSGASAKVVWGPKLPLSAL